MCPSDNTLPTLFPVIEVDLPQFTDLALPASLINPVGPVSPPVVDAADGTLLFRNGQTDTVTFIYQLPHGYREGSDIAFHVHWSKTTSAVGTVNWQYKYSWGEIGKVTPAFSVLASGVVQVADLDTAEVQAITRWTTLVGSGHTVSSIIKVWLQRTSAAGGDTYAANARLISADLHYQQNTFGSIVEWAKI